MVWSVDKDQCRIEGVRFRWQDDWPQGFTNMALPHLSMSSPPIQMQTEMEPWALFYMFMYVDVQKNLRLVCLNVVWLTVSVWEFVCVIHKLICISACLFVHVCVGGFGSNERQSSTVCVRRQGMRNPGKTGLCFPQYFHISVSPFPSHNETQREPP